MQIQKQVQLLMNMDFFTVLAKVNDTLVLSLTFKSKR
jgi:hypothetical protein